jgi:subtilisin family serine protease
MVTNKTQSELVEFNRGGESVSLQKSGDKFLVKLKSGEAIESLSDKLLPDPKYRQSTKCLHKYRGGKGSIFYCPSADRDKIMTQIRQSSESVQYCSHVFQRSTSHVFQRSTDSPGQSDEIGLDNKVFVEFDDKPDAELIKRILVDFGLRIDWTHQKLPTCILFELTSDALINPINISNDLKDGAEQYHCENAEPCLISARRELAIPADPFFDSQWHLKNTGQGDGVAGADCNAEEAWDHSWGSNEIKVAIIDNGFDLSHPDLGPIGKIVAPIDVVDHDTDPSNLTYALGHGTSCAGIAVASRGGGHTVGIAPDCRLMPIRVDGLISDREELLAFFHAYDNSADVISCSWGAPDEFHRSFWPISRMAQLVFELCATGGRDGKGIPIFFAAGNGNESSELDGYASNPHVIAIAASTNQDKKAVYSDYGDNIWVCAPSSTGTPNGAPRVIPNVTTIDRTGRAGTNDTNYTSTFGGTSAAAPLVAGLAALMLSVNSELTCKQIKQILKEESVPIGQGSPTWYKDRLDNDYTDEYDENKHSKVFGYGRINAGAAVRRAANEPTR